MASKYFTVNFVDTSRTFQPNRAINPSSGRIILQRPALKRNSMDPNVEHFAAWSLGPFHNLNEKHYPEYNLTARHELGVTRSDKEWSSEIVEKNKFAWRSLLCASRQFCGQFKNGDSLAPDRKINIRGSGRWISQVFCDTQTETSTPHRTRHFAWQAPIGCHIISQHWRRVEPLATGWILTSTPTRVWSEARTKYSCLWLLSSKRHAPGKPRTQNPQQHTAWTYSSNFEDPPVQAGTNKTRVCDITTRLLINQVTRFPAP